jgi:pimeloyl-ACP methyl ester carboxylesterase
LPGFGFSGKPTKTGWDPVRTARAWVMLMKRLGYTKFVSQGGDLGAGVCTAMANQAPPELLGIHTNFPASFLPTSRECWRAATRHHPISRPTKNARTHSSSSCSRSGAPTRR